MSSIYAFDKLFHWAADVLFIILGVLSISAAKQSRWRIHLNWLIPGFASTLCSFFYRTIVNLHLFGYPYPSGRVLAIIVLDLANVLGLYSSFTLLKTLRKLTQEQPAKTQTYDAPDKEVWPPPPNVRS